MPRNRKEAVAYLRTSSPTNANPAANAPAAPRQTTLHADKDSDQRQRAAINGFANANGYTIVDEFYDVVSGVEPITERKGFKEMLDRIAGNGVRTIIVESPDRFARDLIVQLTGHDYLKTLGVELLPASAPDFFLTDTPTAVLVRQVLGAISQFEKTSLVAKLKSARDRKLANGIKCGGRKSHAELRPAVVALAKQLRRQRPKGGRRSLREIAADWRAKVILTAVATPTLPPPLQRWWSNDHARRQNRPFHQTNASQRASGAPSATAADSPRGAALLRRAPGVLWFRPLSAVTTPTPPFATPAK